MIEGRNTFYSLINPRDKNTNPPFCRQCNLYPCELTEEYSSFYYRHNLLQNFRQDNNQPHIFSYYTKEIDKGCCTNPEKLYSIECGTQNVTDGISNDYEIRINSKNKIKENTNNTWVPSQPVFISAQTGQGKNFFIENTLVPFVERLNQKNRTKYKILILSNRIALKKQIEFRNKGIDNYNEESNIYSCRNCIDVINYQGLLNQTKLLFKKQNNPVTKYLFVICDEAHFFTSDAVFNPDTHQILSTIISLFCDSIRIYMSATPYECLKYILKYEKNYRKDKPDINAYTPMIFYHFKRNYDYLDLKTFSEFKDLKETIINSVSKKKKWLIFIDDIKQCNTVNDLLTKDHPDMKDKVNTLDATDKNSDLFSYIVSEEKLDNNTYVLISTSVLDNGINLNGIDNIVVSDISKVKILQMVGRARIRDKNDKKTLYIKHPTLKDITDKIVSLENQLVAYHDYDLAYRQNHNNFDKYYFFSKYYNGLDIDWHNAKNWFGRYPNCPSELYKNIIAENMAKQHLKQYKNIKQEMELEKEYGKIGQGYLEYQFSWFGKKYGTVNEVLKEFISFLEQNVDNEIVGVEINEFKKRFTEHHDSVFERYDKNKNRLYGFDQINNILQNRIPEYKLTGKPQKGPWILVKTVSSSNFPNSQEDGVAFSCVIE